MSHRFQPICARCHKPHDNILKRCPNCGYQHPLTKEGKKMQKKLYGKEKERFVFR